jgi:ligand-binding sensor domain-containing protein
MGPFATMKYMLLRASLCLLLLSGCKQPVEPESEAVDDSPFWQKISNPDGGSTFALTRASNGSIYVSAESGLYKSTNSGMTWSAVGPFKLALRSLAADSSGAVYAAASDGAFRSKDDGANWTKLSVNSVYASDHLGNIFAASDKGILVSNDQGNSWKPSTGQVMTATVVHLAVDLADNLYAGTDDQGIFLSADHGVSWQNINNGLSTDRGVSAIAVAPNGYVYAGVWSAGLYRSIDGGMSWTLVRIQAPLGGFFDSPSIYSIIFDQAGKIYVAGTYHDTRIWPTVRHVIFTSAINGNYWEYDSGLPNTRVVDLIMLPNETLIAATEGAGVYHSSLTGWEWSSGGIVNASINTLLATPEALFVGVRGGIARSTDRGESWRSIVVYPSGAAINAFGGDVTAFARDSGGTLYAGTRAVGLYQSTKEGINWGRADADEFPDEIGHLAISASGTIFRSSLPGFFTNGPVWRSSDHGNSWTKLSTLESGGWPIAAGPGTWIYVNSQTGVHRSSDDGLTWTDGNLPSGNALPLLARSDTELYAGTTTGIQRSRDHGDSWQINSRDLAKNLTVLISNSKGHLFAGTNTGVYRSTNSGYNWVNMRGGLPSNSISSITVDAEGYVYASTAGGEIYRSINSTDK